MLGCEGARREDRGNFDLKQLFQIDYDRTIPNLISMEFGFDYDNDHENADNIAADDDNEGG